MTDRSALFVLCSLGTRGDILPFLLVAERLVALGHRVDVMTNANWEAPVVATGARFVAIAPPDPPQSGRDDFAFFKTNIMPSFEASFAHVQCLVERGERPALVYRTNMLGACSAAERFGLRNARIALQPSAIRSFDRPPWPMTVLSNGHWGWLGRNLLVPALYAAGEALSRYRSHIDGFRRSVGLGPKPLLRDFPHIEDLFLMMCPRWFCMPQKDWPQHVHFAGFPYATMGEATLPPVGCPIVFTPGTGVSEIDVWVRRAQAVARALDRRVLILSPELAGRVPDERIAFASFIDLGGLLPHCAAIVHHGGVGTTAQAIRAGIPQLIVADRFDQPDNGVRVAQLGLGGVILDDRVEDSLVVSTLERVMRSAHISEQLRIARRLVAGDAVGEAVDHITALIQPSPNAQPRVGACELPALTD